MNILKVFLVIGVLFFSEVNYSQNRINDRLSKQIDSLMLEDQKPAKMAPDVAPDEFQKVIRRNFLLVEKIFTKYGFPGYDLVGKESSHNYWILVQHSDFNLGFQKKVLKQMKEQISKLNASGQDYAYLIDRICINESKEQIYGTQVNMGPGGTKIKPCIDVLNLDERRHSVGLIPIKDYIKQCDDAYAELNK